MKGLFLTLIFFAVNSHAFELNVHKPQETTPVLVEDPSILLTHPVHFPSEPEDYVCDEKDLGIKLIPLPMYSTLPNEGSTFGIMPVFLKVCSSTQKIHSIYAPSVSWNEVIKATATMRYYHYPGTFKSLTVVASVSTHVNWNALLTWRDFPPERGRVTDELLLRVERNIFYRFFGFGPDTPASQETSYTLTREVLNARRGINILNHLNLGLEIDFSNDTTEDTHVPGIPVTTQLFANAPGMGGATTAGVFADLRYDTREALEFSRTGIYSDFKTGYVAGIWNSPEYWQNQLDTRFLVRETDFLQGALRIFANYVNSPEVPFFDQSSLGGSYFLRGFTEDRFIDQGAWNIDLEQRLRVFRTDIYNVITDWRIDPFIAVGQVFRDGSQAFSHVRVSEGIGFRALVQPNILGRVDVAYGGEGLKFYVELGYPF